MISGATMKRLWWRWWFPPVGTIIVAINLLFVLCWRYHIWNEKDLNIYLAMNHECHPAWKRFYFEEVKMGDDVNDAINKTQPTEVVIRGRWTILAYKHLRAAAYDGKMVLAFAFSCTFDRVFFDGLTEGQHIEYFGSSRRFQE